MNAERGEQQGEEREAADHRGREPRRRGGARDRGLERRSSADAEIGIDARDLAANRRRERGRIGCLERYSELVAAELVERQEHFLAHLARRIVVAEVRDHADHLGPGVDEALILAPGVDADLLADRGASRPGAPRQQLVDQHHRAAARRRRPRRGGGRRPDARRSPAGSRASPAARRLRRSRSAPPGASRTA